MSAPDRHPHRGGWRLGAGLIAIAALAIAASAPPRRPATSRTLSEGRGQAIAENACLICHSAMLITQQAKDRAAWERSIVQMQKWGAPVDSAQRDTLAGWLARVYGPRTR